MYLRIAIPLACVAMVIGGPATAQSGPSVKPAAGSTPTTPYQSAYTGYVPYRDEVIAPWREINADVARIGGHKGVVGAGVQQGERSAAPADIESGPSAPAAPNGAHH